MNPERPVIVRRAARVIVVSSQDRLLLFEGGDPDRPHVRIWHAPGGGLEPGENDRQAAQREFLEETGHEVVVGPLVWDRELRFGFNGAIYDQTEVYYLARVGDEFVVDTSAHTEIEQAYLTGHRWFSVAELRSLPTSDGSVRLAPGDLADRFEDLLRDGPPATPVRVSGVVLP